MLRGESDRFLFWRGTEQSRGSAEAVPFLSSSCASRF